MFKNMKIGVRLALSFAAVVLIFLASFTLVGVMFFQVMQDIKQIKDETLPFILVVEEMNKNRVDVQQFLTDVSATHNRDGYKEAEAAAKSFQDGVDKFKEMYRQENDTVNLRQIEELQASFTQFYKDGKEMAEIYVTQGMDAGNVKMEEFDKDSMAISQALEKFREQQIEEANTITTETMSVATTTMTNMIVSGLVATALAILLAFFITRYLRRQLGGEPAYAAEVVTRVAAGDLNMEIATRSGDQHSLLAAMKTMVEKLAHIIGEVRGAADALASASEEVSATAQSLSQSSSEQAASVEETSASIEQMTASINQNTENAKVTDSMATKSAQEATEGGDAVNETVTAMKQIAGKIGIIDDIAYQTNLLALNAAIEAARAGEHGKGFAVVAAEVRKLAERSQVAAQEIGELASGSVDMAEKAGKLLDEMVPSIKKTSDLVQEIAAASSEQSSGVGQINGAMGQLNKATQQNASASEELAATAEEMGGQAGQLQELMAFFTVADQGGGRARSTPRAAQPAAVQASGPTAAKSPPADSVDVEQNDFVRF